MMTPETLSLNIHSPRRVLHDGRARSVRAVGTHGSFSLRPRHVDCVVALLPGILSCVAEDGGTMFFAVDGGILVKRGASVLVSTPHAVAGEEGTLLKSRVRRYLEETAEREQRTRYALRKIEANFVRTFVEAEEDVVPY